MSEHRTAAGIVLPFPVPVEKETVTIGELPGWCYGMGYRSDDDVITLSVVVPASQLAQEHVLALEMLPESARAVRDALERLIKRSEEASSILEVPTEEEPS